MEGLGIVGMQDDQCRGRGLKSACTDVATRGTPTADKHAAQNVLLHAK